MSPVKYELSFYIPEDDILHSHRHENLKPYIEHWCSIFSVRMSPDVVHCQLCSTAEFARVYSRYTESIIYI
jgi:hypothetical protein